MIFWLISTCLTSSHLPGLNCARSGVFYRHLIPREAKPFTASRQLACFFFSSNHGICLPTAGERKAESQQSKRPFSPSDRSRYRFKILPTGLKCFGLVDTEGRMFFFSSHTYAAYTCCTLRAWIEIWWNHLKCCVQHILMMQSWSCRRNIYPLTYFAKFTCLNRIEYEKSTEHAKDPWNRRGKSSEHWYGWVEQATTVEGGAPPAADWTPCFIRSISQADEEGRKWRNAWGPSTKLWFQEVVMQCCANDQSRRTSATFYTQANETHRFLWGQRGHFIDRENESVSAQGRDFPHTQIPELSTNICVLCNICNPKQSMFSPHQYKRRSYGSDAIFDPRRH